MRSTIRGSHARLPSPRRRALGWGVLCAVSVTLLACGVTSWEEYMEAGAWAYQDGHYDEAEDLFLAAELRARTFGADDARLATTLDNLADLYRAQARDVEAEPLYRQALERIELVLGPDHPRVALLLNDLASVYADQERFAEAEPVYHRAVAIWEQARGAEHPDVATSLRGLAVLYHRQERYAEADPLYRRVMVILERDLALERVRLAETLEDYAQLLRSTSRETEAAAMEARARALRTIE